MAKTTGHVQARPPAVTVTTETRAAQLLHVRNVQNMGAVNELLTPIRLPNRFGQAANYRESMARLRRTQRLLASSPSGQWPMPVSGWEAAS